jgi:FdhE protein
MKTAVADSDTVASLTAQIHSVEERKPPLKEILNAFKGIMIAGAELRTELTASPARRTPPPEPGRLSEGVPLLLSVEFRKMLPDLEDGVKKMLTALGQAFPPLEQDAAELSSRVDEDSSSPAAWLGMLVRNEEASLNKLAKELNTETETLRFALEQALRPFLQWLAHTLARHVENVTWDKGYCPICGAYPDTSYLKKGDEEQEYLVAHGGQRWLHCSMCSYEWRLHRICCPYCGNDDPDSLEYFAAKETPHERVYVCHACKKYITCLDTSELIEVPLSDLIPFELLHLDIIAQKKGFAPLAWHQWNRMTG